MNTFYHQDKVIFTEFPVIETSILQDDILTVIEQSNITTLMCSRRIGKTTVASIALFVNASPDLNRAFYDSEGNPNNKLRKLPMMRHGAMFYCFHPMGMELYNTFYGVPKGAFLHAFGGSEAFGNSSLDNTYVRLPQRFYEWLITNMKDRTDAEIKWFFGDGTPENPPIIEEFPIPELKGQLFVKLFKKTVEKNKTSQNANALCKGVLFNGVNIILVAANHLFANYVRGGNIDYIWAEELGQWDKNHIQNDAIQAIVNRGGKIVQTMTPPSTTDFHDPKAHWTYTEIVKPTLELDDYTKHAFIHGIHYYASVREQSKKVERKINGYMKTVEEKVATRNTTVVGRFSECYSYTYKGYDNIYEITGQLKEIVTLEEILDEKTALPKRNEIKIPLLKLNYTGKPFLSGGIDMDTWYREYEMSYSGVSKNKVFTSFTSKNILPETFISELKDKPKIIGFDKGMADVDVVKQIKIGGGSPTMALEFAYLGKNQWVIFNEILMEFDKNTVGQYFLDNAKKGIPIIYDRVIQETTDKLGSIRNNQIYEITQLFPDLSPRNNSGIYNKCLMAGLKFPEKDRFKKLNKMFEVCGDVDEVFDPETPNKKGCYLYITENCKHTIDYFKSQNWKIDKNKEQVLDKNGDKVPEKIMNEPFDCASYVIDTFDGYNKSSRKQNREIIEQIWRDPRYKNITQARQQYQNTTNYTFFNRPRFGITRKPKIW